MQHWLLWLIAGLLSVLAGILALANPFAATLTAELLAGYSFVLIGVLTLVSAFQDQGWGARILAILLGAALTYLGISLLGNPLAGIVTLTVAVAIMMAATGITRILIAFSPAASGARLFLVLAGAISLLMSVMILSNFPWASAVVLGIFLAIELLSNGVSLIFIALERRKVSRG